MPEDVYYAEIDCDYLVQLPEKRIVSKPISKYPIVERDIAVVVDEKVTIEEMLSTVKSACGNVLYDVKVFDIYRSKQIGENKKSVAVNIKLSDLDKTLTEEDISQVMKRVLKALTYKLGASLR